LGLSTVIRHIKELNSDKRMAQHKYCISTRVAPVSVCMCVCVFVVCTEQCLV
jgi:hypothetical protein